MPPFRNRLRHSGTSRRSRWTSPLPYDESADAKAAIQQALTAAKSDQVPVLVIFGANWCEDCRSLDTALQAIPNAALMAKEFKVVKVDVGRSIATSM